MIVKRQFHHHHQPAPAAVACHGTASSPKQQHVAFSVSSNSCNFRLDKSPSTLCPTAMVAKIFKISVEYVKCCSAGMMVHTPTTWNQSQLRKPPHLP